MKTLDAMYELYSVAPHEMSDTALPAQYAKVKGVELHVARNARHFIMWDDPDWMFGYMDRFLSAR